MNETLTVDTGYAECRISGEEKMQSWLCDQRSYWMLLPYADAYNSIP